MKKITEKMREKRLFFDGGTGTVLQGKGLNPGEATEVMNSRNPEAVLNLHLDYLRAGADIITIHYESCDDPLSVVRYIKSNEAKAAVSIKPATPAEVVFPMLEELDMVLVMTVEPGFGGQKLIPEALKKVREIREYANEKGINIDIQVDGGITPDNVKLATSAGANIIVAGSAIFKADRPSAVIAKMKDQAKRYPFGSDVN